MPLYEYQNTRTGKTEARILPVAQRDAVPSHLKRITVPSRIGVNQKLRCPSDVDQAMPRALRDLEIQHGSRTKELLEKETGFTRDDLKRTWFNNPATKEEIGV